MRHLLLIIALLAMPFSVRAQCPPIVSQFQGTSSGLSTFNSFSSFNTFQPFATQSVMPAVGFQPLVVASPFLVAQPSVFVATPTVFADSAFAANVNVNVRNRGLFGNRAVTRTRTVTRIR